MSTTLRASRAGAGAPGDSAHVCLRRVTGKGWIAIFHERDRITFLCLTGPYPSWTGKLDRDASDFDTACVERYAVARVPHPATPLPGGPGDFHPGGEQVAREHLLSLSVPQHVLDTAQVESHPLVPGSSVTGIEWVVVFHETRLPCDTATFRCVGEPEDVYQDTFVCLTSGADGPARNIRIEMSQEPIEVFGRGRAPRCPAREGEA